MLSVNKQDSKSQRKRPPATTPEAREKQLISLAVDLAEKQLENGTASSQVLSHFLKMGSPKEKLEREMLVQQNKLIKAKAKAIKSGKHAEELYINALDAMRTYSGNRGDNYED